MLQPVQNAAGLRELRHPDQCLHLSPEERLLLVWDPLLSQRGGQRDRETQLVGLQGESLLGNL